jgi:uncharacterized protein YeeX (DUF496 family)
MENNLYFAILVLIILLLSWFISPWFLLGSLMLVYQNKTLGGSWDCVDREKGICIDRPETNAFYHNEDRCKAACTFNVEYEGITYKIAYPVTPGFLKSLSDSPRMNDFRDFLTNNDRIAKVKEFTAGNIDDILRSLFSRVKTSISLGLYHRDHPMTIKLIEFAKTILKENSIALQNTKDAIANTQTRIKDNEATISKLENMKIQADEDKEDKELIDQIDKMSEDYSQRLKGDIEYLTIQENRIQEKEQELKTTHNKNQIEFLEQYNQGEPFIAHGVENFTKSFKKALESQSNIVIAPIGFHMKEGGHANIVIFNKLTKKLFYFEPHIYAEWTNDITNKVTQIIKNIVGDFQFEDLSQYFICPTEFGAQRTLGLQSDDPYCQSWSVLAVIVYLLNPDVPIAAIFKALDNKTNKQVLISQFMYWLEFKYKKGNWKNWINYTPKHDGSISTIVTKEQLDDLQNPFSFQGFLQI